MQWPPTGAQLSPLGRKLPASDFMPAPSPAASIQFTKRSRARIDAAATATSLSARTRCSSRTDTFLAASALFRTNGLANWSLNAMGQSGTLAASPLNRRSMPPGQKTGRISSRTPDKAGYTVPGQCLPDETGCPAPCGSPPPGSGFWMKTLPACCHKHPACAMRRRCPRPHKHQPPPAGRSNLPFRFRLYPEVRNKSTPSSISSGWDKTPVTCGSSVNSIKSLTRSLPLQKKDFVLLLVNRRQQGRPGKGKTRIGHLSSFKPLFLKNGLKPSGLGRRASVRW